MCRSIGVVAFNMTVWLTDQRHGLRWICLSLWPLLPLLSLSKHCAQNRCVPAHQQTLKFLPFQWGHVCCTSRLITAVKHGGSSCMGMVRGWHWRRMVWERQSWHGPDWEAHSCTASFHHRRLSINIWVLFKGRAWNAWGVGWWKVTAAVWNRRHVCCGGTNARRRVDRRRIIFPVSLKLMVMLMLLLLLLLVRMLMMISGILGRTCVGQWSCLLHKTLNFQCFSNLKQCSQLVLSNVHFSTIHVLKDCLHLWIFYILQHHNRMPARELREKGLEIWWACCQYHLVALNRSTTLTSQGHICKCLTAEEFVKHSKQIGSMVVPPETVLLCCTPHLAAGERSRAETADFLQKWSTAVTPAVCCNSGTQCWGSCVWEQASAIIVSESHVQ